MATLPVMSIPKKVSKDGYFLSYLMVCSVQLHIYHLCSKSFAEHTALGSLYSALPDMIDSLAESIQGRTGILKYDMDCKLDSNVSNVLSYLKSATVYINDARKTISQDTYIQNQIDGVVELFYSTIYKLENLK